MLDMADSLEKLIDEYRSNFYDGLEKYINSYRELDYEELIKNTSYALECSNPNEDVSKRKFNKRHGHQRERTNKTLDDLYTRLNSIKEELKIRVNSNCTFEDLYNYIASEIYIENNKISGVGPLFLYDTSVRIGSHFNILPNKKVYIHYGPKKGLETLFSLKLKNDEVSIDIDTFENKKLLELKAYHIENFLCIYKDGKLKNKKKIKCYYCNEDNDPE